jgi:hypothetical protein
VTEPRVGVHAPLSISFREILVKLLERKKRLRLQVTAARFQTVMRIEFCLLREIVKRSLILESSVQHGCFHDRASFFAQTLGSYYEASVKLSIERAE